MIGHEWATTESIIPYILIHKLEIVIVPPTARVSMGQTNVIL
jgi:hypothetical protein